MALPLVGANVVVIGQEIVDAKLVAAAPRILAHNRLMVTAMLAEIKPIVIANTPVGPGHFGYHLRDTIRGDVRSKGVTTIGVLKSAVQGYWREYGTRGHARIATLGSRAHRRVIHFTAKEAKIAFASGQFGSGGERAFMTAHHAAAGVKRFIRFYYGGMANWWNAE